MQDCSLLLLQSVNVKSTKKIWWSQMLSFGLMIIYFLYMLQPKTKQKKKTSQQVKWRGKSANVASVSKIIHGTLRMLNDVCDTFQ